MGKKIYLRTNIERGICKDFSSCNYLKVDWMRERFCYKGGGCPEKYAPVMKSLIKRSLE